MKKPQGPAFALLTLIPLLAIAAPASAGKWVGKEFPNFTAQNALTKNSFELDDFKGKIILVDFWATWCGPCVRELPNVRAAHEKYKDQGLEIISISLDTSSAKFRSFLERHEMNWHHVMEGGGWNSPLAKKYDIRSIPAMFVIDHRGVVISDTARGPGLQRAIERAIERRGKARGAGREAATAAPVERREMLSPDETREMGTQLRGARLSLLSTRKPVDELVVKLNTAQRALNTLAKADPTDVEGTMAMYERLQKDLVRARHDLFLFGMLDDRRPLPLPAAGTVTSPTQLTAPLAQSRVVLTAMLTEAEKLARQIDSVERRADNLGAKLRKPRRLSTAVRTEHEAVEAEVAAMERRLRGTWRRQLDVADAMVTRHATAAQQTLTRIEAIETATGACRRDVNRRSRNVSDLVALRDRFTGVCTEVEAVCAEMVQAGVLARTPRPMPSNPLTGGQIRDARARTEAAAQLDLVTEICTTIRAALTGRAAVLEPLGVDLRRIKAELPAAEGDGRQLAALERQFKACSRTLLAVADS